MTDFIPQSAPFQEMVALGLVPGWESFRKFGRNDDVDAGTEDVWQTGGTRIPPTVAATASVVSTNAADADGGTGAQQVTVQGLDANYLEASETVTMNGTTPVVTTQTFIRINRAFVVDVGTSQQNVGDISVSVGGNEQATIEATFGQTQVTHFTVPADKFLMIVSFTANSGRTGSQDLRAEGQIRLYDEDSNNNYQSWRTILDVEVYEGQYYNDSNRTLLPPRTDVRGQAISTGANLSVSIVYGGYLIKADTLGIWT